MNTLTRVFAVLTVVLSIVYLGVTSSLYAYRVEYKRKWEDTSRSMEEMREQKDRELARLTASKDELNRQLGAKEGEISTLQGSLDEARTDVDQWHQKHDSLQRTLEAMETRLQELSTNVAAAEQKNQILQERLDTAMTRASEAEEERDSAQQRYVEAFDQLQKANKELTSLTTEYIARAKDIQVLKEIVDRVKQEGFDVDELASAKAIDGVVQAVSQRMNLLILSVGRDEGVQVGTQMTVFRGSNFVTKIVVEKVDRDWASARSMEEFEKAKPQVGDKVSTRIN